MFFRNREKFNFAAIPAALEKHDCNYSQFMNLLYDRYTGNCEYPDREADEKIREIFCDMLGVSTEATQKEYRQAVRRNQNLIFEILEEIIPVLIPTGWDSNPFFMEYVEVKNLALGDTNAFVTEDDTVLIVNRLAGNHWDLKRQRLGRGKEFSVETEWYGLAVYAEFERVLMGVENWSYLVSKIAEAFNEFINNKLFAATMAAINDVPNAAQFHQNLDFSAADASRDAIVNLAYNVQTWTGQDVAILGTHPALAKLRRLEDINWIASDAKNELYRTGKLGTFMGIRLIEIPQVLQRKTFTPLIDPTANTLLLMPTGSGPNNKFIKMVYEGDARIRQITDETANQDMTYEYMYQQKLGLSTIFGYQFGTVTITG